MQTFSAPNSRVRISAGAAALNHSTGFGQRLSLAADTPPLFSGSGSGRGPPTSSLELDGLLYYDYGCDGKDSSASSPSGNAEALLRVGRDGTSHIKPKFESKHIEPVKSEALEKLLLAMRASVGICAADEKYKSTNFQGVVTCFHSKCTPKRL